MACPSIITGDQFITRVLAHIDCQSRYLGSYGYEALGQPGSTASTVMAGLLTLFVALWGFRLLFGPLPTTRAIATDAIKIGLVLTLAFSWPAFRTIVHGVVLDGPAEIAASLGTSALPSTSSGFVARLQGVDNAIVQLTDVGTGRGSGQFFARDDVDYRYDGTGLQDESGFAWARLIYLSGMIGSLALLRLLAGLLLAVAPLAAGLLLFEATRGLFSGWLRGLILSLLGSIGVTVILAVQVAVLEPWLLDALKVRSRNYAVTSAPIELFALTLAFAVIQFGVIWFLAKVAFMRGWPTIPELALDWKNEQMGRTLSQEREGAAVLSSNRVLRLSEHIETRSRSERERLISVVTTNNARSAPALTDTETSRSRLGSSRRLGSGPRRVGHTASLAARRRDSTS